MKTKTHTQINVNVENSIWNYEKPRSYVSPYETLRDTRNRFLESKLDCLRFRNGFRPLQKG